MYKKLILTTALGLVMFASDSLAVTEGKCGANCTYTMDDAGNVVVSGTGVLTGLQGVNKADIKSVSVGEGITKIGDNAFSNISLKNITIPSSVSELGHRAFYASYFDTVDILSDNIEVNTDSFTSVKDMNYAGMVKWSCGEKCSAELDKNGHLQIAGEGVMGGIATGFSGVTINATVGEGITSIGANAFARSGLENIDLPNTLESIASGAFSSTKLKNITIPSSVSELENRAFYASYFDTVDILSDNIEVNTDSFTSVKDMNYAGMVKWSCGEKCSAELDKNGHLQIVGEGVMGGIATGFSGVTINATVGEGITSIGANAFARSGLENIDLPNTLESIASGAFSSTKLKNIILPPYMENLGNSVFYAIDIQNVLYYSDEQKEALKALGIKDSALTPYIINDDGTVYYTDKEGFDIRFGTYNAFKKGEVLEKYKLGEDGRTYVYSADNQLRAVFQKNTDGSTYIYDENGKLKEIKGKKIYTVEEAMAVTRDGNVNHVRLTYK